MFMHRLCTLLAPPIHMSYYLIPVYLLYYRLSHIHEGFWGFGVYHFAVKGRNLNLLRVDHSEIALNKSWMKSNCWKMLLAQIYYNLNEQEALQS